MSEPSLRVANLTRSFSGRRVVDGVNLTVARGEIMGFLGPNGAGKTTVMNMIMGLVAPDGGEIELLGVKGGARHRDVRLRVGYLQEKPRVYPEMSGRGYLSLFAKLYGVPDSAGRVATVLDLVRLARHADRPLGTYSRGMQQRACLARLMLHEPEFLLLDEPTIGLDPTGVVEMREILLEMREAGATLLLSSHQLAEVERICDRVAFMKDGRLTAAGAPDDLVPAGATEGIIGIEVGEAIAPAIAAIRSLPGVREARATGEHSADVALIDTPGNDGRAARVALARELTALGLTVLSVTTSRRSLEELFLALAGTSTTRH